VLVVHGPLPAADLEAGGVLVDQEAGDAAPRALARVGDREQDHVVGLGAVGDEVLAAVDDPAAVQPLGPGADAGRVGAGVRLGEREAGLPLGPHGGGQIPLLLLRGAVEQDVGGALHARQDAARHGQQQAVAGALLLAEDQAEVADATAADRLGHEQGVVALGGGALAKRPFLLLKGLEGAGLGDLLGVERLLGGDLALDEGADRLPQGDQLLRQLHHAHGAPSLSDSAPSSSLSSRRHPR
jgi:hypothetical protein